MARKDEFTLATERGRKLKAKVARTVAVRYDKASERIVFSLSSGVDLGVRPQLIQGLENAKASELSKAEISRSGFGIYFPKLDVDVYVPGLMEGAFGSKAWMASRLGALGGKSRSLEKRQAARENGKLGGRPKKVAVG